MNRSALPFVRGVNARVRRCRRCKASQALRKARDTAFAEAVATRIESVAAAAGEAEKPCSRFEIGATSRPGACNRNRLTVHDDDEEPACDAAASAPAKPPTTDSWARRHGRWA